MKWKYEPKVDCRHPGLRLPLALAYCILAQTAQSAIQIPDCDTIIRWGANGYEMDKNVRSVNFMPQYNGKYLYSGLRDDSFKPIFKTTFGALDNADIRKLGNAFKDCFISANQIARKAYRKGDRRTAGVYSYGSQFLSMLGIIPSPQGVDQFVANMEHQKKVYAQVAKAQVLMRSQLEQAGKMEPTRENIAKVRSMIKDPQFAYLRPEEKRGHAYSLNVRASVLASNMALNAMKRLREFPESLQGLKDLQAFHRATQKELQGLWGDKRRMYNRMYTERVAAIAGKAIDEAGRELDRYPEDLSGLRQLTALYREMMNGLGGYKGKGLKEFKTAYTQRLNVVAMAALDEFIKELNELPVSQENMLVVDKSVDTLFRAGPQPENLDAYREVAKARRNIMRALLNKKKCYGELGDMGLDEKYWETATLGKDGEITLGLLVCQISRVGYRFQEYEPPGLFGSTHYLKVRTPRGVELTIEMKMMEPFEGQDMLVGVLARDASRQTRMNGAGWQEYVRRMYRGGI